MNKEKLSYTACYTVLVNFVRVCEPNQVGFYF